MKKLSILFVAVMMMSVGTIASAQYKSSASGGKQYVSPNTFNTFWAGYAPTTMKSGSISYTGFETFFVGMTHVSPLSGSPLLLEYGGYIDWSNKTTKEKSSKYSIDFFDVKAPVNVIYPLQVGDTFTLLPYAGLHGRAFVVGKTTYKYSDYVETDDFFDDNDVKRITLGYQVGVRAQFSKFIAGIGYEYMLTSMSSDVDVKVNYLTLYVGFPF